MTKHFEDAFREIILIEGGYANSPYDSGGETMYGCTKKTARAFGYNGEMKTMSLGVARDIYSTMYWKPLRLDDVSDVSPELGSLMFSACVHTGIQRPALWLQRMLNVFNRLQFDYRDIKADGYIGDRTLASLREFEGKRGAAGLKVLTSSVRIKYGDYLLTLAEEREKDERWIYGWISQRIV